jgi:hypothetical protein
MKKFLFALLGLVVVLVIVDRAGLFIAEREIGTRIETAYDLPSRPGVSVRGFPFLTQVASGDYQQIDVSISRATSDGVAVRNLNAQFTGVRASLSLLLGQDSGSITASHATGSALIPFSEIQQRLPKGITLGAAGSSSLRVSGQTSYGTISGTARVRLTSSGVRVTPESLSLSGVPVGELSGQFSVVIPVGTLPLHLTVSAVHVTTEGIEVDAAGNNVQFASA